MKKTVFFIGSLFCLAFIPSVKGQTFVDTIPTKRNAVLEEYTGVNCQYCPDGHKRANELAAANPGRVVVLNIHQGGYAQTTPDYRTQWGDALANQTGLQGYPAGTVNRHVFTGTATALNRGDWAKYAAVIMGDTSCVNVAAKSSIDWDTRKLTVTVEAYYTKDSKTPINLLNVALLQDSVLGPQSGASQWYPAMLTGGLYKHNHMLRDLLTGQWGDTITQTAKGSFFTKTYTYDLPLQYKNINVALENLHIAVFVTEGKQEIITGVASEIHHIYRKTPDLRVVSITPQYSASCDASLQAKVVIKNISDILITSYELKYVVSGVTNSDSIFTVVGENIPLGATDVVTLPMFFTQTNAKKTFTVTATKANGDTFTSIENQQTVTLSKDSSAMGVGTLTLNLWQDRYGSETTWKLFGSDGITVIKSGGPYANLSSNTTQLRVENLGVLQDGCYKFEIYDSYGDGINAGAGAGKYELWAGADKIHSSAGTFGSSEAKYIRVDHSINYEESSIENLQANDINVNIYPNPASDEITIVNDKFTVREVQIFDLTGKLVLSTKQTVINIAQLASGTYSVRVLTDKGLVVRKIVKE